MNRNNTYRLKLRALREEFAETAKRDARRARLIANAERMEAEAEVNLLHCATQSKSVAQKQHDFWLSEI